MHPRPCLGRCCWPRRSDSSYPGSNNATRSDPVLSSDVPHGENQVLVLHGLHAEIDRWDGRDHFANLAEDRGLSPRIKPNHQDPHLGLANLISRVPEEKMPWSPAPTSRSSLPTCTQRAMSGLCLLMRTSTGVQGCEQIEHQARLPDRPGHPDPRSDLDPQQRCVNCWQQGLTCDREHQNFCRCERTLRLRETDAHAKRQFLWMNMFCSETLQRSSTFASNTVHISDVHVSNQTQTFAFCTVIPKTQKRCAARVWILGTSHNHGSHGFQNPRHASPMKQVCDGSTCGNNFGRARRVLKSFLRHILQRRRLVEFW